MWAVLDVIFTVILDVLGGAWFRRDSAERAAKRAGEGGAAARPLDDPDSEARTATRPAQD